MGWLTSRATLSTTALSILTSTTTTTFPTTPTPTRSSRLFRLYQLVFLFGLLSVLNVIPTASAFTFRFQSAPSQCGSTKVVWTAGTPPYKILLLPIGFQPEGVETRVIFEKSVSSGTEMDFTFPFPGNSKFVAVMSDSTGFGTGGTSPILTVGSSNSSSCLPTTPSQPEFYMYLSSPTLTQCSPVHVSWDNCPNPPVSIYGVIPQGQSFDFGAAQRANGGSGFDWNVNVKSGTQFFFVAGDTSGSGKGGSTDATTIKSGGSSCLSANSPSSTPDSGTGGTDPLPGSAGGSGAVSGPTLTGSGVSTAIPTGGSQSGGSSGDGSGNGNGNGNDGSGSGSGNGNGNGNDPGSGGGTVVGPFQSTGAANSANLSHSGSKAGLIVGLILGILALCVAAFAGFLLWKRHEREKERRNNQRARLLPVSDLSDINLTTQADRTADLPHPRPPYFSKPWAGPSLENLGSSLRVTPFPWPLNRNGSSGSPTSPRADRSASRDPSGSGVGTGADNDREGLVSGRSSARRPGIDSRATSSSGMLRRLRSTRFGDSGYLFGTPSSGAAGGFGSSGGYRSLGDSGYNSTPSSNPPVRNANNSSSLFATGGNTNTSNDSRYSGLDGPVHKSPLPASYYSRQPSSDENAQDHTSQNPFADPSPLPFGFPFRGADDSLVRPGSTPSGPRPPPGMPATPGELRALRPGMQRADTSGSVWEVPPTYSSLRRKNGHEE